MITAAKLIYDTKNLIRGGQTTDDDRLSDRQILHWWNTTRAQLIRQDLMKGRAPSDNIIQGISCVDVSVVDASLCCGITTDCKVLRTTTTIPKPIDGGAMDMITKVGPVAVGERSFSIVPMSRIPYIGHSPFPGINNEIRAVYDGGYIYIFVPQNDRVITKINIEGVFEDPTEAGAFTSCTGEACYTNDSAYPITAHMIETAKQMIIQTNLKLLLSVPSDNKGDGNFSVQSNLEK